MLFYASLFHPAEIPEKIIEPIPNTMKEEPAPVKIVVACTSNASVPLALPAHQVTVTPTRSQRRIPSLTESALNFLDRTALLQNLFRVNVLPGGHDCLRNRPIDSGGLLIPIVGRELTSIHNRPPSPFKPRPYIVSHVHKSELDILSTIPANLVRQSAKMRDSSDVDVVDFTKVKHHHANRRECTGIGNTSSLAQALHALLGHDRPVTLLLGAVGAIVDGGVVCLDGVDDAAGQAVRVGEEEGLVEAEDVDVLEHGISHVAGWQTPGGIEGRGELGASWGGRGGDRGKGLAEDIVEDVEDDGDEDAELGGVEECEPEG